ncbi:MAG TPA: hypothetical protein VE076_11255 [Nitrososphaeraceae archaeon]|nr:hypothetical protein [Nitrososphaeraceae archaeon]
MTTSSSSSLLLLFLFLIPHININGFVNPLSSFPPLPPSIHLTRL